MTFSHRMVRSRGSRMVTGSLQFRGRRLGDVAGDRRVGDASATRQRRLDDGAAMVAVQAHSYRKAPDRGGPSWANARRKRSALRCDG